MQVVWSGTHNKQRLRVIRFDRSERSRHTSKYLIARWDGRVWREYAVNNSGMVELILDALLGRLQAVKRRRKRECSELRKDLSRVEDV